MHTPTPTLWQFSRAAFTWKVLLWLPVVLYLWFLVFEHPATTTHIGGSLTTTADWDARLGRIDLLPSQLVPPERRLSVKIEVDRTVKLGLPTKTRIEFKVHSPSSQAPDRKAVVEASSTRTSPCVPSSRAEPCRNTPPASSPAKRRSATITPSPTCSCGCSGWRSSWRAPSRSTAPSSPGA